MRHHREGARACRRRQRVERSAVEPHAPLLAALRTDEHAQERALAASVGPHDGRKLAVAEGETDAVESACGPVVDDQVLGLETCSHVASHA